MLGAAWLLFWVVSLATPVAIMGPLPDNVFPGWSILMVGWLGVFVLQFGWFANLVFVACCTLIGFGIGGPRTRFALSIGLSALAINALFWREMYGDNGSAPILSFGLGYYLWFIAMFGAAATLAGPPLNRWVQAKNPRS